MDLAAGTITPPDTLDPALAQTLQTRLRPSSRRADVLAAVRPNDYSLIWPHLRLLSCWADGPSAPYAAQLAEQFPSVIVQGKGLLATEAFVTLPLMGRAGGALAVTAHFFEFLAADGAVQIAHQLQRGETYAVIVTTGGGLYRYRLHDLVEVVDFVGQTPCLRFVGKTDQISDYFGEKLNEQFVATVLANMLKTHQIYPQFLLLAPDDSQGTIRYTLYLETTRGQLPSPTLHHDLEAALCANFHYAYCRNLGQLASAQVVLVKNGYDAYLRACQHRGQKLGNIKPRVLDKHLDWQLWFEQPQ
jgi:hypothetical protein